MSKGPNFEQFRKALLLQGEPDRVPLAELLVDQDIKAAFMGKQPEGLQDELDFWVKAGYDFIPLFQGLRVVMKPGVTRDLSSKEKTLVESISQAHKAKYSHYREERIERRWAIEHQGAISTQREFESFPWPNADELDYSILDQVGELLPNGMKIVAIAGEVISLVYALMGQETFYVALYENPGLVAQMFEKIGNIQYQASEKILKHECVGAIWVGDDLGYTESLLVSPKHLREHLFPWYKKTGELCRQVDKPFILHSDGRLYDVIDDLIDCGLNALHPIEPKAMDIAYVKKKWGNKLCLMGNIDLAYTLTLGTEQEVEEEVKQRLREIAPGGGYCIGSSNSITEYVPLANYNAMRETALKYGRYPISI